MSTSNPLQIVRNVVLALALALALVLVLPASSAWASFGTDTGDGGDPGSGGDSGSPTNPGGGGGGTTPPVSWKYRTTISTGDYAHMVCPSTDSRGMTLSGSRSQYRYPSTMTWAEAQAEIAVGMHNARQMGITGTTTCIYPPGFRDVQVKVVLTSDVTITREKPTTATLSTIRMTSPWQRGDHSVSGAYASDRLSASASTDLDEYGHYLAKGETKSRWVTIRKWDRHQDATGKTYSDSVVGMGPVFTAHTSSNRATLDCRGFHNGWVKSSFSHTDCGPTSTVDTPIYQCVRDSGPAVKINGEATSIATLFRSGEGNLVEFAPVRAQGVTNITGERTRFTRNDGTPWKENGVTSVRDANFKLAKRSGGPQLFTNDETTAWMGGIQSDVYAHGTWASRRGSSTVITPHYSYSGEIRVETVTVTGVDSAGGWSTSTHYENVNALAICSGPSAELIFVRAVAGG